MLSKKWAVFALIVFVGSMILSACAGEDKIVEVTRVVTEEKTVIETVVEKVVETVIEKETIIEEKVQTVLETVIETVVETVIETVVVEAEMPEPGDMMYESADPSTFVWVTFGDIDTLDPQWNYESLGDGFLEDIYDMLVAYQGPDATTFAPELATSWEISADGKTYVFNIREGVTFHEGQDLTPEDVAYSFQRGLLQGGGWSPQWLYTEAFFGIGTADISELVNADCGDDAECLQAEDPAALLAACEQVTSAIVADDDAGTVTFNLAESWGPLLATIAGSWGAVIDKDWAIENGTWDGDCATWQNYYGIGSENAPLRDVVNGTGPYMMDHWTPGEEFVMVRNENYWRDEATHEGGPSGVARVEKIVVKFVDEWGTRFAMAQAGDADIVSVPRQNVSQIDPLVGEWCTYIDVGQWDCQPTDNPDAPLRLHIGHPLTSRTDAFFVFDINTEGGNPYIGSGQLDGNGVPADFFSDEHVRKAFNYCFDWDAYINDALVGEAIQNYGPINQGLIGYDNDADHYSFDPDKCAEELQLAWDGQVWENGFRFQIAFNTGNTTRQTIASILQANLRDIDPKFQIEIVGLPWPSFLAGIRAARFPIFVSGWGEDIHDPHNWAQPFLIGTYAARQKMPDWMLAEFKALVDAGVSAPTPEERAEIYLQIQQLDYDYSPGIRLAVPTGRSYKQRWVSDWLYNPMLRQPYYDFAKE